MPPLLITTFLPAAFKYAMHAALFTLPVGLGLLLMSLMRYSSLLTLYFVLSGVAKILVEEGRGSIFVVLYRLFWG